MGAMQNNPDPRGKNGKKRGSVKNDDRLAAFASGGGDGSADWGGCDSERMQSVVTEITSLGGAITFGLSRDMGAHSLTLMLDGSRKTLWFNGSADLDSELGKVAATLDSMH